MMDWWRIITPKAWFQHQDTDSEWDAILNDAMDRHDPVWSDNLASVAFGNLTVWAADFPYDSGGAYMPYIQNAPLPFVRTRMRLELMRRAEVERRRKAELEAMRKAAE